MYDCRRLEREVTCMQRSYYSFDLREQAIG